MADFDATSTWRRLDTGRKLSAWASTLQFVVHSRQCLLQASTDLWLFFAMVFGVVVLPGMDMAFVASSALTRGSHGGFVAVAGIIAAGMVHTAVGVTGVAALLVLWPEAFNALLVVGAASMVWVGISILRSSGDAVRNEVVSPRGSGAIFCRAVLTCLLNPKAYAFMLAVFPAFIQSPTYSMSVQALRLGAVITATQLLVYGAVVALAVSAKHWTRTTPHVQRAMARTVGMALIAGAVLTLTTAWRPANAQSTGNLTMSQPQPQPIRQTAASAPSQPTALSSAADFDFFIGTWTVAHRRLKSRLNGNQEWVEFAGTTVTQKILGGLGNVNDNVLNLPSGSYRAVTLRAFDPATRAWSIWWLDGRNPGQLDTPVVGSFEARIGTFHAEDTLDGRRVRVRFQWTVPKPDAPRWEQAFSADAGATWETNWVMDFTRAK